MNVFVNVEQVYPLLAMAEKAMDKKIAEVRKSDDEWKEYELRSLQSQKNMMASFKQFGDFRYVNAGMSFGETGVYVDICATAKSGTDAAKQFAAARPLGKNFFAKLPNNPYVIAGAGTVDGAAMSKGIKDAMDQLQNILKSAGAPEINQNILKSVMMLSKAYAKEVRGISFVAGGAKNGLFGVSVVYDCKNASKVRKLFPKNAKLVNDIFNQMVPDAADSNFKFEYKKGAFNVGAVEVDMFKATFNELNNMSDEEKDKLKKIFGSDEIVFYTAQTDDNTIVVTIGGGKEFLKKAVKAAKDGGNLNKDAGIKEAFKALPGKKVGAFIFSPKNLLKVVMDDFAKMGIPFQMIMPFQINLNVTTPIAGASYVKGLTGKFRLFIPNKMMKEFVMQGMRIQGQMNGGMGGGGARPPMEQPDDDDGAF